MRLDSTLQFCGQRGGGRCHIHEPWGCILHFQFAGASQVVEREVTDVLVSRPDLTARLDVTWPEPPAKNSPLYRLPNAQLSSHIAGSINNERIRMADCIIEEFMRYAAVQPLRYAITSGMLRTMA